MTLITDLLPTRKFVGRVEWIGIAAEKSGTVEPQEQIELVADAGIVGDHHFREQSRSKRQVTLIQHEHLAVVAALLGRDSVDPALLRRNIVVSGINLAALKNQLFSIGGALLQGTGDCVPCELMESNLGAGGYAAMVAHGGITTTVAQGGTVKCGDPLEFREVTNV